MKVLLILLLSLLAACNNSISLDGAIPGKNDSSKIYLGSFPNWESHAFLCGISYSGKTKCWGKGYLGNAALTSTFTAPIDIGFSGATSIATIDANACAIRSGAVYCWGRNEYMEVANSSRAAVINPTLLLKLNTGTTKIDGTSRYFCALKSGGIYCWGFNQDDILKPDDTAYPFVDTPTLVTGATTGVTDFAVGKSHICAVKSGALYCWGNNVEGELGDGIFLSFERTPKLVPTMTSGVTKVWANHGGYNNPGSSTCALKNGDLYCWGNNDVRQTGFTAFTSKSSPALHPIASKKAKDVLLTGLNGCMITIAGEVWCWGLHINAAGYMDPTALTPSVPVKMTNVPAGITRLTGDGFTLCYQSKTEAKCHGANPDFEIDLTRTTYTTPTGMPLLD